MKLFYVLLFFITTTLCAQNSSISGIISDVNFPLPQASVRIEGSNKGVVSDLDGHFILRGIPAGNVKLEFYYMGYAKLIKEIVIKEGEDKNLGIVILNPSTQILGDIVIKGSSRRNSEARALNMQRKSLGITNVIAADGIGKLPDRNAAETVQRIQGVSIERDQGEGRFVSIRGLPPFWSSTTINGNRLPTAEEQTTTRATAFDFFPSEMISFVQANKAYTPDMEADGIGGGVNFITQTSPAKEILSVNLGSGFNAKAKKPIYNVAITYGNITKNKKFRYILNGSYWNRNWATDNFEARRKGDAGVYRLELRDYTGYRQTIGFNGGAEYRPSDKNKFFFRGTYGTLIDKETHYKHRIRFDKFDNSNNTATLELQNIYNELITQFIGGDIGGKHNIGKRSSIDWQLSSYSNDFRYGNYPNSKDNAYYIAQYQQKGLPIDPSFIRKGSNGYRMYWKADGGKVDFNNVENLFNSIGNSGFKSTPNKMQFVDIELSKVSVTERDNIVASVNYKNKISDKLKIKFGAKYRDKVRMAKYSDEIYIWNGGSPAPNLSNGRTDNITQPNGSDYLKEIHKTDISNIFGGVMSKNDMRNFWETNKGKLKIDSNESVGLNYNSGLGRNFDVHEIHASVYGMGGYEISPKLTVLGGLRATHTTTRTSGHVYDDSSGLQAITVPKIYWAILPMLHVKYSPEKDIDIRFAVTRSFSRPNFGDLCPGGSYMRQDRSFKGGNPLLNPTFSWNYDLLGSYYFKSVGVIQGGVFYKSIKDPIFNTTYQGTYKKGKPGEVKGVEFSTPKNGKDAWVGGVELGFNTSFDFLPGFMKYFGVQLNATFMASGMVMPSGRKTRTAYQPKQLYNAQLFFENKRINIRLALNHKGSYAIAYGKSDAYDFYYGKYTSMDATATYNIGKNKKFMITLELMNLLNRPLVYHYGTSDYARPQQVEYYGIRGMIGVKYNL